MADTRGRRATIAAAGRGAVAILKTTGRRAKLGSLHLPLAFHPSRANLSLPVAPVFAAEEETGEAEALRVEVRALRSRLAQAERRTARLRHALQRERLATARAGAVIEQPKSLIDQLSADIAMADPSDHSQLRETITSVLAAHGFRTVPLETGPMASAGAGEAGIPGLDRATLQALIDRVLGEQPEIGDARYIRVALAALARQGALTLPQLAGATGMSSPMARRRLRLAAYGLERAGALRRVGAKFMLADA